MNHILIASIGLIKKMEEVDTSKWKPAAPTSTGGKISESEMMEKKTIIQRISDKKKYIRGQQG